MTYERGVGLTDACGSGACASVVVSNKLNLCNNKVNVSLIGGNLDIEILENNQVHMIGDAEHVFEGKIELGKFNG